MPTESLAARIARVRRLEVILKVAERCNINCTYCYFFNGADQSYQLHPKSISDATCVETMEFLARSARDLHLRQIQIDFHGGEPLLLGPERFARLCSLFEDGLRDLVELTLCVQTNGMLIDDGWIDVFAEHDLAVGVSLDGPADYHDQHRVTHGGAGTHAEVVAGLERLLEAAGEGRIRVPGVLCVIDPARDPVRIYEYFTRDLGINAMDFLLPDATWHDFPEDHEERSPAAMAYGDYLARLYHAWVDDDDPDIQVRILNSALRLILGGSSQFSGLGGEVAPAITISSDGSVGPDDTLRACGSEAVVTEQHVGTATMRSLSMEAAVIAAMEAAESLPQPCRSCSWQRVCGGGALVNRFRSGTFDQPSVLCEGLMKFYSAVAADQINKGLRLSDLLGTLGLSTKETTSSTARPEDVPAVAEVPAR